MQLLAFAWESGCRPQEVKRIEARHVEVSRMRVVFPKEEAKGKRRARVIHLTATAAEILSPLVRLRPEGPLFVNADGRPWTSQAAQSSRQNRSHAQCSRFRLSNPKWASPRSTTSLYFGRIEIV
ncbi:MAG: hypothetical protein K2V38_01475 [Gemmataceae bacterium]|nr:hypothetical protein [Gemmataceae bacterium]